MSAPSNVKFYDGKDGKLWFHLDRPSSAGSPAIDYVWDGHATLRQISEYKGAYEAYLKAKKKEEDKEK